MNNVKAYIKNTAWACLYLAACLSFCFAVFYFSEKNLPSAFIAFPATMLILSILIMKDIKFLSLLSFLTMFAASFLIFAVAAKQVNGIFLSSLDEKIFLLALALILSFLLANSIFWAKTKRGWRKATGLIVMVISVLGLLLFGLSSPNYYQNFIYTRIFILILFILSIFLIKQGKRSLKILGILGIFFSIGALLLSAALFAGRTYKLEEREQKAVIAFIDPRAKEMFGYYNEEDYNNFCKYCGPALKYLVVKNPMMDKREAFGPYIYFGEPKIKREMGRYYVEYPVKFQNVKDLRYVTFVLESTSPDSTIYGFEVSDKQKQ
jgi:hypothetical protein